MSSCEDCNHFSHGLMQNMSNFRANCSQDLFINLLNSSVPLLVYCQNQKVFMNPVLIYAYLAVALHVISSQQK